MHYFLVRIIRCVQHAIAFVFLSVHHIGYPVYQNILCILTVMFLVL